MQVIIHLNEHEFFPISKYVEQIFLNIYSESITMMLQEWVFNKIEISRVLLPTVEKHCVSIYMYLSYTYICTSVYIFIINMYLLYIFNMYMATYIYNNLIQCKLKMERIKQKPTGATSEHLLHRMSCHL